MIVLENISKVFGMGNAGLSDLTLTIEPGEFVFLVGHTGSGKTTLLRLLLRQYLPTTGKISVADIDLVKLPKRKVSFYRKKIGIVFQDLKLLMDRTIFENVLLPLDITGKKDEEAKKRVEELLTKVGMLEHRDKFPVQLSGGELQRVAIARALTLAPAIILADEPTGNLDTVTAFEIVELLHEINKTGTTIVMATHNLDVLKKYPKNRVIGLRGGKLELDKKGEMKTTKNIDSLLEEKTIQSKKTTNDQHIEKKETQEKKQGHTKDQSQDEKESVIRFKKNEDMKDKSILTKILQEESASVKVVAGKEGGKKHGSSS